MALLILYYVCTRGVFQGKYSGDGLFGFEYLRALIYGHTLDMQKVVPEWRPYFGLDPHTHHMPNRCPFGPVLVWLPFYLIGCAIAEIGARLHLCHLRPDSLFHAWMAGLGTLAAVLVGYRQVYVMIERHLGRGAARLGATVSVWATPIAWYAVTQPMYQHGCAFGAVALLIERWDAHRGDPSASRFFWLGAIGGLGAAMREQEALYLLLPGCEALYFFARGPERRRWLVGGIVLVAGALIAFSPQLAVFFYYTGGLRPPQVEPLRLAHPMVVLALFSTRAGLFPWSPIAYASTLGIALGFRARRSGSSPAWSLAWPLGAVFLVELYVVASAFVPAGGYGYGARRLSDAAPFLALGAAMLYDQVRAVAWKRVVAGFTALCVALCLFSMEMQRAHRTGSSGGYARTAGAYLREVRAPVFLQRLFDAIGYPFSQPAGWLFALAYRVPLSTFDGVVGNFLLDRDGQWFTVLTRSMTLDQGCRANVISGLSLSAPASHAPAIVTGPVRILLSMFASEHIAVTVAGAIPEGAIAASWNGAEVKVKRLPGGCQLDVPRSLVRVGVNDLRMELPAGAHLSQLEFLPLDPWRN